MRKTIYFIFICVFFLKFFNAKAQESKIKFGAYLDTYYSFDFSKPLDNQRLYVTQYDKHNEFNLSHAWVSAAYEEDKVRASLALQVGTYPANNYGAEPEKLYQMVYEAYAGYQVTKKGWLDVGIFGGHFGYESALSLDRDLYSPALATEYTPYYQSGLRYTHDLSDKTQLRAVVLNGWQNIGETNNKKSLGIAVDHTLNESFKISYCNYFGNESTNSNMDLMRFHNNLILEAKPLKNWKIAGVLDYTTQSNSATDKNLHTSFITVISKYTFSEKWSVAGRYENINDKDDLLINGITGQFAMNVISLSVNYYPTENAAFKLEAKTYKGPYNNFAGEEGVGAGLLVLGAGMAIRLN